MTHNIIVPNKNNRLNIAVSNLKFDIFVNLFFVGASSVMEYFASNKLAASFPLSMRVTGLFSLRKNALHYIHCHCHFHFHFIHIAYLLYCVPLLILFYSVLFCSVILIFSSDSVIKKGEK